MFQIEIDKQLQLKLLHVSDAESLFVLTDANRAHLKEWLPWVDYTQTVVDSQKFIEQALQQFAQNKGFQAGIFYNDALVGMIGLHEINWSNRSTAIGYWLAEEAVGNGIMTKATRAVLTYVFEFLKLNRVDIRAASGNVRSQAIPKRLGFVHEGTLRQAEWLYDHFVDLELFTMLREEYEQMH